MSISEHQLRRSDTENHWVQIGQIEDVVKALPFASNKFKSQVLQKIRGVGRNGRTPSEEFIEPNTEYTQIQPVEDIVRAVLSGLGKNYQYLSLQERMDINQRLRDFGISNLDEKDL